MRVDAGLAQKRLSKDTATEQEAGKAIGKKASDTSDASAEATKVAAEFETLFMDLVIKGLRQTAKPAEESNAQDIFTGMLDQEYTKVMTGSREFGIKSLILDWMKTVDPKLANPARLEAHAAGSAQETLNPSRTGIDAYKAMSAAGKIKP